MANRLSEKWIKASITGTIWAASEIVLGSFLHNLKVPFSGNILTAIGIIILISISYKWNDKGLFWRSGIICALMKTMSPSAVIFGPMIAILTESLLLEFFVRLIGRNIPGYIVGSMFAMSWNLFQKIINYIIFYGSNIIGVYTDLINYARKQLVIKTEIVWLPIIILLVVYALFGVFAAIMGIRIGRKLNRESERIPEFVPEKSTDKIPVKKEDFFSYSLLWLLLDLFLLLFSFYLLNRSAWTVWSPAITAIIIIWSLRYRRALRQLARPKFWIFFVFITLITAFLFTRTEGENLLQKGLLVGIQMNFRAVVIITGFSVLGTELYNPVIRKFFLSTSFRNLPMALELSAESLPSFISAIPDFRTLLRDPVSVFSVVITNAEKRLEEIRNNSLHQKKVFIITGSVGEGKTELAGEIVSYLREHKVKAGGILSERIITDGVTTGYNLIDIETGSSVAFLRQDQKCGPEKIGRFFISPEGIDTGIKILSALVLSDTQVIIIDEVGQLELNNGGWAACIDDLLLKSDAKIIMTVRESRLEEIIKKWNLVPVIFHVSETDYLKSGSAIIEYLKSSRETTEYS